MDFWWPTDMLISGVALDKAVRVLALINADDATLPETEWMTFHNDADTFTGV